jgi:hypothetical protein
MLDLWASSVGFTRDPMRLAWMPSFVVFVLTAAGLYAEADGDCPKSVVPNVPDLTIRTRQTTDLPQSTVQTNTLYFKGAWQRRDLDLQFPPAVPAPRTVRQSTITRCDDRQTLELNHEARLYAWSTLSFIDRDVHWVRSRWRQRPEPPTGPDVKVTIDTVDTGERRQRGSYSARHIITTITTDPSAGANTRPSEYVEDGWHIDLPPAGCVDAGGGHSFLIGSVVGPRGVAGRMNVEFRGAGRRGFPVEQTTRHRGEHEPPITTRVELIEFSEAVLDTSLFDVPAGYRPALPRLIGRFDMSKPDTVANRLAAYWQDVTTLTRSFFRF